MAIVDWDAWGAVACSAVAADCIAMIVATAQARALAENREKGFMGIIFINLTEIGKVARSDLRPVSRSLGSDNRDQCLGPRCELTQELQEGWLVGNRPAGDRTHGAPDPLRIDRPGGEATLFDFLTHGGFGNDGDGLFGLHGRLHSLDILEFGDQCDLHARLTQHLVEMPAGGNVGREADEALSVELLKRDGAFAPQRMLRGHHEHEFLLPAGDGSQAGARLGIGDQSQISPAILHRLVDLLGLAIVDGDLDSGMVFSEQLEERREIVERDADDTGHSELPSEFAARDAEARAEALVAGQDVAADLQVDATLGREGEVVVATVDERDAEALLHRTDLLAHRALGDAARLGGAGKVPRVAEIAEDLEALDMHEAESALVLHQIPRPNHVP